MRGYAVIIPSANPRSTETAVKALRKSHPHLGQDRILIIDDGARESEDFLKGLVTWIPGVKPFIFSRNVNLGIKHAKGLDIVIMGDDVDAQTPGAFDRLSQTIHGGPKRGVVSAGIEGLVGNVNQKWDPTQAVFEEKTRDLAFVCVYLNRDLIDAIGLLDERFTGYGCDDVDYCWRTKEAGWSLWIDKRVKVIHAHRSAYRAKPDLHKLHRHNKDLLNAKWAGKGKPRR